ncbi:MULTISPECIES: polysaccharide pyruvyl transferase family protein [unclassified Beijerinckia]|uniref:polysaccharide pyruvyl transferase family protein n=1 Tax=unclassified Beijerinckia TaxID=2638183 RepID=UPI000896948D|nr:MULTISPECIES: polysaccharide pyruvyl transferase family protein [unclassified Beijerinckia]MDH7797009.1 polysaccharide pyruvyl transferase WcaK-like protein [Beijerinckia sp. GAS462]SEC68499.1 Polysaccharide pyruvyl transferase [Beijerinckia sp. 28-YEA-48]
MSSNASWLADPKWINAAKLVYRLSETNKFVFTVEPLCRLRTNCLPLAFAHLATIDEDPYAVVAPKDDIDMLPLAWIRHIEKLHIQYADDVFFAATTRQTLATISTVDDIRKEMGYCLERCTKVLNGIRVRADRLLDGDIGIPRDVPYCLIVNAALADNVGEVLLAKSAIRLLNEAAPHLRCIVADPDVDRTIVANASLVIIGPGGMLYDLDDHDGLSINLSNISSYFRIGFLAREYGIPYGVLGAGCPAAITSRLSKIFLQEALRDAKFIHLRDSLSLASVSDAIRLQSPTIVAPDVSIVFQDEIAKITQEPFQQKLMIACGSFNVKSIAEISHRCDMALRIVIQATEDLAWLKENQSELTALVPSVEIVDVHQAPISALFKAVASGDCLLSTRFHAMMIGIMAGLETVAVGVRDDKRHRVKQELRDKVKLTFIDSRVTSDNEFISLCCGQFMNGKRSQQDPGYSAEDLAGLRQLLRTATISVKM